MAGVTITNWLGQGRTAGVLFDLQKTPMVSGTDGLNSNPKKTQSNEISSNDRGLFLNWPADAVVRIRRFDSQNAVLNKLELETVSVGKWEQLLTGNNAEGWDAGLFSGFHGGQDSTIWSGGNNKCYSTATIYINEYQPADLDGDGIPEDYWAIATVTVTLDAYGFYTESSSVTTGNTSPNTSGLACAYNGVGTGSGSGYWFTATNNSIYATFGTEITAKDWADLYAVSNRTAGYPDISAFCMRHPSDAGHNLSSYVYLDTQLLKTTPGSDGNGALNRIFAYRHAAADVAAGWNQLMDTTCKWYHTSTACEDCWYKDKVVTVEVIYKKAQVTKTVAGSTLNNNMTTTYTLGAWSAHSTDTQVLTIPGGTAKTQVGSTFTVPTQAGYVVAIDDIKLVSVA